MSFRLQANVYNTGGTEYTLTASELESLTNGVTSSGVVTVSGGGSLILVADLLNRYDTSKISYYYSGASSITLEAADAYESWTAIPYSVTSSGIEALVSGIDPRWIKLTHQATEPSEIYQIDIFSREGNILLGPNGEYSSYGLDASGTSVQETKIYNTTDTPRDIHIFVDNVEGSDADELLVIGLSESGPFYGKYDRSFSFPGDLSWDLGSHNDTITTISGHLTLSGAAASGTYYSPVIDIHPYQDSRFFWTYSADQGAYIDFPGSVDSESCFGVRRFHISPSGSWSSGDLAEEVDTYWSLASGTLPFVAVPNNSILELRDWRYLQFCVTISGTNPPYIYSAGVETPLTVSGVHAKSYKSVYISSQSGTTSGKYVNLLSWYRE